MDGVVWGEMGLGILRAGGARNSRERHGGHKSGKVFATQEHVDLLRDFRSVVSCLA
jgi:hypothetical protein